MEKPEKVMRSFEADKEEYQQFKAILAKDGEDVGEKLNQFIKKFNQEYGDGNPGFSLDQFFENDAMLAVPAVFRSREDWLEWLLKIDDEDMLQNILGQAQTILGLADNRILELRGHTPHYG